MSTEENKAIVRRFYAAYNDYDLAALDAIVASDYHDHNPAPGQGPGLTGLKQLYGLFHNAFADLKITVEEIVAEGDTVATRAPGHGTHTGDFLGIPATHKVVTIESNDFFRLANGKITDGWHVEDLLGLMIQLGVIPPPGQPPH
jgi:steroid delta-isomerase-like uncharacterized protein